MTYIFLDRNLEKGKKYEIYKNGCNHLFSFKPTINDVFYFTDFKGSYSSGKIIDYDKKDRRVIIEVKEKTYNTEDEFYSKIGTSFSIALSCPDKIYLDKFIEMAMLFPVKNIYLFFSKRSLNYKINIERINKIMLRSSSQCQRIYLPKIHIVKDIASVIKDYKNIFLFDTKMGVEYKKPHNISDLLYIMGPEGGFDKSEIDYFIKKGVNIVSKSGLIMPSWASIILI